MRIVESEEWDAYKVAWIQCMKDYYWFKNDPVFDWNRQEALEEMERQFGKPGCTFVEAHSGESIVGVLGYRYRGEEATLRRWEPASISGKRSRSIDETLLKYALECLGNRGIERTTVLVKHPADNAAVAAHLSDLFSQFGFIRYQPDSVDLVAKLDTAFEAKAPKVNVRIDSELGLSPENVGEYCVRAYASTPEDLEVHSYDKSVTDYDTAVEVQRSIMAGRLGPSPSEFWKVALVNGEPAGFTGGFALRDKHKPITGVLGLLGVFPEYRRLGIGLFLVSKLLASMKDYGCEYTAVSTPAANRNAIGTYQKAGYGLNCHLTHLEKVL